MKKIVIWGEGEEILETKSNLPKYIFSVFLGILIVIAGIILFRWLAFLFYTISTYWIWLVGAVVALLVLRKIVMKKRVRFIHEAEE